jgi:myo-inositol-1(or 4)-monophosphatase
VVEKSTASDFQTKADLGSEKNILTILKKEFPNYNIFSEEEGKTNKSSDYTLVIDPLDGTNNFVLGIPTFSVSIALMYKNEAILGVIYQPIIDQTYTAIKGKGSYLNGRKIKVNNITDIKKVSLVYSCGYKIDMNYFNKIITSLYETGCKRAMNNFSVAFEHCMLAAGKIESLMNDGTELYDYIAGKLIALEAGAKVIDLTGKEEKDHANNFYIISNTEKINQNILKAIKPLQKNKKWRTS